MFFTSTKVQARQRWYGSNVCNRGGAQLRLQVSK